MIIAIDTETTGTDLHHGAKPYFVTICDDKGKVTFYSWSVNPLTREPRVLQEDVLAIRQHIQSADEIVGQNIRFDVHALRAVGVIDEKHPWPWQKTHDTLVAAHLLASGIPKSLDALALTYLLDVDIRPLEDALKVACKSARAMCRSKLPSWRIARSGMEDMPSVKGGSGKAAKGVEDDSPWKADGWLPRALAKHFHFEEDHPWWTVLKEYANADSQVTLMCWKVMWQKIQERKLEHLYRTKMRLCPIIDGMESRGLMCIGPHLDKLEEGYREESEEAERLCVGIARSYDYDLEMPKTTNNKSLTEFVFDVLKLPVVRRTEKGNPSFDKYAIEEYCTSLPPRTKQRLFCQTLKDKRKRDIDLTAIENYKRFRVETQWPDHWLLHYSLNQVGTAHLRFSSSNPNSQNIGKQEDECERCDGEGELSGKKCLKCRGTGVKRVSMRWAFGPPPGREWWKFDYENIEQRIPAYYAPEPAMIELFERPDDPPFFGSYHLLNASLVYPELFWPIAHIKGEFKTRYGPNEYQWVKNFGFAKNYGGGEAKCDQTAHRKGAFKAVGDTLKNLTALNHRMIALANRQGYVETIPDKTLGGRGYPIMTVRSMDSRGVDPTKPLNYFVSGTAMWCTIKAMIRVEAFNQEETRKDPRGYFTTLQVHDELVLDYPKGKEANYTRVREVKRLMEQSGEDIGIPLKVSVGYHPNNWAEEEKCEGLFV